MPDNIKQQDVCDRFRELEQNEVRKNGILFPGVVEMLEELLLKGQKLYICANGSIEYIKLVLENTGITKYFSMVYSAKEFSNKAEVIRTIVTNNHQAIVIGDTISDIEAAVENNIPTIEIAYGYGKTNELCKVTFISQCAENIIGYVNQTELFYTILERCIGKGKKILGINGVDTSGKTEFTFTIYQIGIN